MHGPHLRERYEYIASFVEEHDTVLEPGCGPALLVEFLPRGSQYRGFDLNDYFVKYASRKYSGVWHGDVLDLENYSEADVVVLCDVLHHVAPDSRRSVIRYSLGAARKKLVICEEGRSGRQVEGPFFSLSKWWFEYFERDGTNTPKLGSVWTRSELRDEMERGFDVIAAAVPRKITEIGEDFIVCYSKP